MRCKNHIRINLPMMSLTKCVHVHKVNDIIQENISLCIYQLSSTKAVSSRQAVIRFRPVALSFSESVGFRHHDWHGSSLLEIKEEIYGSLSYWTRRCWWLVGAQQMQAPTASFATIDRKKAFRQMSKQQMFSLSLCSDQKLIPTKD